MYASEGVSRAGEGIELPDSRDDIMQDRMELIS